MKIAIASFTRNGCVWNQKLCAALKKHSCEGYALEKYGKEAGIPAIAPSLPAWTERMFQEMDAILFIGACGIAVRSIAPYVKSKKTDPAVLCMDEQGKFVISLLSGHIGGANELTEEVAMNSQNRLQGRLAGFRSLQRQRMSITSLRSMSLL